MVIAKSTGKLTYEDYAKTPDDERWELLNGELTRMPSPVESHQLLIVDLGTPIHIFVKERSLGRVIFAPYDVVLSDTVVVQPDILFVSNERAHIRTRANIQGAPDLVVEVLSPSTAQKDRTIKLDLYAQHGVKECWLVDPDSMTVMVLLMGRSRFELVGVYGRGQTLISPTLHGFTLDLDEIF